MSNQSWTIAWLELDHISVTQTVRQEQFTSTRDFFLPSQPTAVNWTLLLCRTASLVKAVHTTHISSPVSWLVHVSCSKYSRICIYDIHYTGSVVYWLGSWTRDGQVVSSTPMQPLHCRATTLGKLFTPMCLCSPSSIIWYLAGAFMLTCLYVAAIGRGPMNKGSIVVAVLQRSDRLEPRYKLSTLLYFYFYRDSQNLTKNKNKKIPHRSALLIPCRHFQPATARPKVKLAHITSWPDAWLH